MKSAAALEPQPPRPRRRWLRLAIRILAILAALIILLLGAACILPFQLYGNFLPNLDFNRGERLYKKIDADRAAKKSAQPAATPADPVALEALIALPSWPGFRGPNRDGVSAETGLLDPWPEAGPPMLYRQPLGAGWAGFSIGLGRAYTIEQRREKEAVTSYDLQSGTELWAFEYSAAFSENMGGDGPRATPTLVRDRLYSLGAQGDLYCLNALTGEKIWGANIIEETGAKNLIYGTACSPLVLDGRVLVTSTGEEGKDSLLAYDAADGKRLLKTLPQKQGYASLQMATISGAPQLLNVAGKQVNGLDPADGKILWSLPWKTQNDLNIAQPVVAGADRVFVSSGYGHGAALIEVKSDAGKWSARELWFNSYMKNKFSSSILHEGHIYGLDEGVLACLDAETGKRKWKGGKLGHGQLLLAEGNLIVMAEKGEIVLVKATPDAYQEKSRAAALTGKTWNVPALAGGLLLVRNDKEMACFDLRRK